MIHATHHPNNVTRAEGVEVAPADEQAISLGSTPHSSGADLTDRASSPCLTDLVEAFLLSRRAGNCSPRTLEMYTGNLQRFVVGVGDDPSACSLAAVQAYLVDLRTRMKPVSVHQHFRTLRTFFAWCVESGLLTEMPMRGLKMKTPKTLPRVPDDDAVRGLLQACSDAFEGRRNKALVALLADSGLRIGEALRLRVADVNFLTLTLAIRGGKGGKDSIGHFQTAAAHYLREWLKMRSEVASGDYLFVDRQGRPLSRNHGTHILHRLSVRAGLPRKIGPHALRHYAATSILRQSGDLELVRQVLRHESLVMTVRYLHLTTSDVAAKFRRASPLNALRVER